MRISDKIICVYDYGLYTYIAQFLARYYKKVYYYVPWKASYPASDKPQIGMGIPNVERVFDFFEFKRKGICDIYAFFDIYDGDLQVDMRAQGLRVFGSGDGEILERDRWKFKDILEEVGLPVGKSRKFIGIDEENEFKDGKYTLREYLQKNKDKWIKTSDYRADFETFHHVDYVKTEPWLDDVINRIGPSRKQWIEIIVEDNIHGDCEIGWDGFVSRGDYGNYGGLGYEIKDQGIVEKVVRNSELPIIISNVNSRLSPVLKKLDYRGAYSSELRIYKGKPYYIDCCYSEDTEILTSEGWKLFSNLNGNESVCTLNVNTREIEYHIPYRYIHYPYNGTMLNFTSPKKVIDLLVTPEHKMWGSQRKKENKLETHRADSIPCKFSIPRTGIWKGESPEYFIVPSYYNIWISGKGKGIIKEINNAPLNIKIEYWLAFMGIFLAEGNCDKGFINIAQTTKKNEMRKIVSNLGLSWSENKNGFRIFGTQLSNFLSKTTEKAHQKCIPDYIKNYSPILLNIFLDAYILGDGYVHKGQRYISTSSKQMANDLQELFLKVGSVADIRMQTKKGTTFIINNKVFKRNNNVYIVSERKKQCNYWIEGQRTTRSAKYIKSKFYKGMVYDIEVQNHCIYIRRNGKPLWSSNCARSGSPPGEVLCELFGESFARAIWDVAEGRSPVLSPVAEYGAEILLHSEWLKERILPVDFPKEESQWYKFRNLNMYKGKTYLIPQDKVGGLGAVIAIGKTLKEVIDKCKERAEKLIAFQTSYDKGLFDTAEEYIAKGQKWGIKF